MFRKQGIRWIRETKLVASNPVGPNPSFGNAVSINQDASAIIVGALFDAAQGFHAGAAHVFEQNGEIWNELFKLTASDGTAGDGFGLSVVSHTDDAAFIAAPRQADGTVYLFVGLSDVDCNGNGEPDGCDIWTQVSDDQNDNSIPDECEARGDLNGDGTVGIVDLLMLLAQWGPCMQPCPPACSGDTDGNCDVDVLDFLNLLTNWG